MDDKKKSFVMYTSYSKMFDRLSDEKAGILIKAIMHYVDTGEEPELDEVLGMAFTVIQTQLDADLAKYHEVCERRKAAGAAGGKAKSANASKSKQKVASASKPSKSKQKVASVADNENDNEYDNEYDNDNDNEDDNEDDCDVRVIKGGKAPAHPRKPPKETYGEYQNVRLTEEERNKLCDEYGEADTLAGIKILDEYIEETGKKYKSHYLVMKRWVFDAVKDRKAKQTPPNGGRLASGGYDWENL